MKLKYYHIDNPELDKGVITSIEDDISSDEVDDKIIVITNDCDGGGRLSKDCCLGFEPEIGDKVKILIDEDEEIEGWIVVRDIPPKTQKELEDEA